MPDLAGSTPLWLGLATVLVGIATVMVAQVVSLRLGLTTRPTHGRLSAPGP